MSSSNTDPKYHYVQIQDAIVTLDQLQGQVLPTANRHQTLSGWNPAARAAQSSIAVLSSALQRNQVHPTQTDEVVGLVNQASTLLANPPTFTDMRPDGAQDGLLVWTNFSRR